MRESRSTRTGTVDSQNKRIVLGKLVKVGGRGVLRRTLYVRREGREKSSPKRIRKRERREFLFLFSPFMSFSFRPLRL